MVFVSDSRQVRNAGQQGAQVWPFALQKKEKKRKDEEQIAQGNNSRLESFSFFCNTVCLAAINRRWSKGYLGPLPQQHMSIGQMLPSTSYGSRKTSLLSIELGSKFTRMALVAFRVARRGHVPVVAWGRAVLSLQLAPEG